MCDAADNVAALVASCRNCLRASSLMAMLHELSTSQTHPIVFNNGFNVCVLPGVPKTSCAGTYAECLLLGVKRTFPKLTSMSAFDPKRTLGIRRHAFSPDLRQVERVAQWKPGQMPERCF